MNISFVEHLLPFSRTKVPTKLERPKRIFPRLSRVGFAFKRLSTRRRHPTTILLSKKSMFQDFQEFAKPLRLLPASTPITYLGYISEERISSTNLDDTSALYVLELQTSTEVGSSLNDVNAAILICMIDVHGDCILQRISAASFEQFADDKEIPVTEVTPFDRGSVETITFKGSKLANIAALWVGLESGSWRLESLSLIVIPGPLPFFKSVVDIDQTQHVGLHYKFDAENVLFGDKGVSNAELRPVEVSDLSRDNFAAFLSMRSSLPSLPLKQRASNEETMKEYADLKFSLLLYDLILISSGSTLSSYFNQRASYDFLVGGILGFVYLLLLQKSVDGLSPTSSEGKQLSDNMPAGQLKGPLIIVTLITATLVAAAKYRIGGGSLTLMPVDIFIGGAGFLTCKIAVLLAAFKPLRRSFKEN